MELGGEVRLGWLVPHPLPRGSLKLADRDGRIAGFLAAGEPPAVRVATGVGAPRISSLDVAQVLAACGSSDGPPALP
jgi:hypothetical protein